MAYHISISFTRKIKSGNISVMSALLNEKRYEAPSKKGGTKKKKIIISVATVAVVVFAVGGFLLWRHLVQGGETAESVSDEVTLTPEEMFERIDAENRRLAEQQLQEANSPEESAMAYLEIAKTYAPSDYLKALEYAQRATTEYSSVDTWIAVSNYAEVAGDEKVFIDANTKIEELGGYDDGYQE